MQGTVGRNIPRGRNHMLDEGQPTSTGELSRHQ